MRYQRTIKNIVECTGTGLHTGVNVSMRLYPAPTDTGIMFIRSDKNTQIEAKAGNIVATEFSSTLGSNGSSVRTVEHLLAAATGLNIDNMYVELNSSEVPIMDGSAYPFVELILKGGIVQQERIRPHIRILDSIEINEGNSYIKDLAPARTFVFQKDVHTIKERGLGKGGSLENVIILDEHGILNKEGLRFKDEFIRHKVLDLIGDLSLLAMSFIGHVTAFRTGHTLNTRLAAVILANSEKWVEAGHSEVDVN